ncbi:uncharacterized protein LOC126237243 isoform X2 [Schistocerca nitens]|uniref:uncharacterized protein LOC126237243 isoform X2 n=1 Tax=Schistocerca nitens TaxID=7011 RepID=UPI0021188A46|nr:uncharacterized protein LOC126237243 isoform X2 [Schistocerca nitens]
MHAAGAVASVLALLVANGTSVLDCVCNHLINLTDHGRHWRSEISESEHQIWLEYCQYFVHMLTGTCETLESPSAIVPTVAHLTASISSYRPPPPPAGPGEWDECAGAMAELRHLTWSQSRELKEELGCRIAADCIDSCLVQGFHDMEWNVTTLQTDHLRRPILSQSLYAVRRITRAILARGQCEQYHRPDFLRWDLNKTELRALEAVYRERLSNYWRDFAQLVSFGVAHVSQLLVPLAFEHVGNHMSEQKLHGWIKHAERVKDMLHTKLSGWVHDMQSVSRQTAYYETEEDKERPGYFIFRRPLLNDGLLNYQPSYLSFYDDISVLCQERQPEASKMFGLADALYAFSHSYWYNTAWFFNQRHAHYTEPVDEEWQLEDRSNITLSVDTNCMYLLANALDHPTCTLEDLPLEAVKQYEQCRMQLWDDMVQRSPHIPVTSYLAYTQRANVNLCLLAWMAVSSFSICQDIPFSMIQSVHDARCYFDCPDDQSCLESNATDAICSVSRAILLLKCRDFSSFKPPMKCGVRLYLDGSYSATFNIANLFGREEHQKATEIALNYKHSLISATLKYKDFKIDRLKPLEISFISVNIIFRFLTAAVYLYLPNLRNLPGKIFLAFQITGIIQILCSEVVYRMVGFPDLSTAVLIDSALTLLSCIWLNSFCYQMYACVRHLKLPNDLLPSEVTKVFRLLVLCALIPWSLACAATSALEKANKYYLIHSRIIFLVGISLSVALNLVFIGLVGYIYLRNKKSMTQLRIYSNKKYGSKKDIVFMLVKSVFLSGIGVLIRIGFHQAQGVAQFVYYVHITTMMQGPLLFVFFICNGTTLPVLKNRVLAWLNPNITIPEHELCSAAERNLERRRNEHSLAARSTL